MSTEEGKRADARAGINVQEQLRALSLIWREGGVTSCPLQLPEEGMWGGGCLALLPGIQQ